MKALESLVEAVRRIIPVPERDVDHFGVCPRQFLCRQGHPARPDVIADRYSAKSAEYALIVEGRQRRFCGDRFNVQRLRQILFDIIDRFLESFDLAPHHDHPFPPQVQYIRARRAPPDFLCPPVPGPAGPASRGTSSEPSGAVI